MSSKKKERAPTFLKLDFEELSLETRAILEEFRTHVKGQDRALEYIVDALEVFKAGMRNPKKPIATMLFLGPSGVGKTRVCEVLSKCLFGGDFDRFTKIRCSEYAHGHEVSRLTGAPPGYIGHIEGPKESMLGLPLSQFNLDKFDLMHGLATGTLMEVLAVEHTRNQVLLFGLKGEWQKQYDELKKKLNPSADIQKNIEAAKQALNRIDRSLRNNDQYQQELAEVLKNKNSANFNSETLLGIYEICKNTTKFNSIILFDEIEKAHEDFRKHLLEIMDRAALGVGSQVTSFKNSFVFMTSNVGSKEIARILSGEDGNTMGFKKAGSNESVLEGFEELDKKIYKAAIDAAEEFFTPEFLGRIDKIVVFRPLSKEILSEIFDLELSNFNQRNLTQAIQPIVIRFTEAAKNYVLDSTIQHNSYGARMIEKKLDRTLKVGLARLANKKNNPIVPGDVIWVDWNGEKVIFKKEIIEKNQTIIIG